MRDLSDLPTLEDFKENELEGEISSNQTMLPFDELSDSNIKDEIFDSVSEELKPPEPTKIDSFEPTEIDSSQGS